MFESTGLDHLDACKLKDLNQIGASPNKAADLPPDLKDVIWRETEAVAKRFNYDRDSVK